MASQAYIKAGVTSGPATAVHYPVAIRRGRTTSLAAEELAELFSHEELLTNENHAGRVKKLAQTMASGIEIRPPRLHEMDLLRMAMPEAFRQLRTPVCWLAHAMPSNQIYAALACGFVPGEQVRFFTYLPDDTAAEEYAGRLLDCVIEYGTNVSVPCVRRIGSLKENSLESRLLAQRGFVVEHEMLCSSLEEAGREDRSARLMGLIEAFGGVPPGISLKDLSPDCCPRIAEYLSKTVRAEQPSEGLERYDSRVSTVAVAGETILGVMLGTCAGRVADIELRAAEDPVLETLMIKAVFDRAEGSGMKRLRFRKKPGQHRDTTLLVQVIGAEKVETEQSWWLPIA